MQTKLVRKKPADPAPLTQLSVRRQLNQAVEGSTFRYRDPLDQVTEQFRETFDQIGRQRAAQLTGADEKQTRQAAGPGTQPKEAGGSRPLQAHPELSGGAFRTFSELAFQRGNMAAAVLQGTGRMMLATCLKRSLGQAEPLQHRQNLFAGGSQARTVPGSAPDQMVFWRGCTQSAVGLVVDVLTDARAVVDSMAQMAGGTGALEENEGAQTLRRVYPFLDDKREQALLARYRAQLAETRDPREKPVLQNAIVHTHALIERKAQMKEAFINKLRWISDKAQEALQEMEERGYFGRGGPELAEMPLPPPPEPPGKPEERGTARCSSKAAGPSGTTGRNSSRAARPGGTARAAASCQLKQLCRPCWPAPVWSRCLPGRCWSFRSDRQQRPAGAGTGPKDRAPAGKHTSCRRRP